MKKAVFLLLVMAVASGSVFAADLLQYPPSVNGGNVMIDLSVAPMMMNINTEGGDSKMAIPPIVVSADYALPISIPISVGVLGSYYKNERKIIGNTLTETAITFVGRGNWHWNINASWLDLYTGISIGYMYYDTSYSWIGAGASGLVGGAQAGAHFYFTKFLGLMVEVGYPFAARAGIAFKFGS